MRAEAHPSSSGARSPERSSPRCTGRSPRSLAPRALEKARQRPDLGAGARKPRDRGLQRGRKPGLRLDVIAPVHQQQARDARARGEALGLVAQPLGQRVRLEREVDGVAVAVHQVHGEDARPVGRLPPEERLVDPGRDAAPEHRALAAEAGEQLGKLTDVAELVGHVADPHHRPERAGVREPAAQVADQGLARHQPLVGQHEPGPDQQAAVAHQLRDALARARTHLEVVREHDRLTVEREVSEAGVALEQVEDAVEQVHEANPERLVRQVPLAVPVRVRNEDEMAVRHVRSRGTRIATRAMLGTARGDERPSGDSGLDPPAHGEPGSQRAHPAPPARERRDRPRRAAARAHAGRRHRAPALGPHPGRGPHRDRAALPPAPRGERGARAAAGAAAGRHRRARRPAPGRRDRAARDRRHARARRRNPGGAARGGGGAPARGEAGGAGAGAAPPAVERRAA